MALDIATVYFTYMQQDVWSCCLTWYAGAFAYLCLFVDMWWVVELEVYVNFA